MKVSAIIAAGGKGSRLGAPGGKQLLELSGKPILIHTLERIIPEVQEVVVVIDSSHLEILENILEKYDLNSKVASIVPGGESRAQSVKNGFYKTRTDSDLILIHDGARPFIKKEQIQAVIKAAENNGAAVLCVKVKDTIKQEVEGSVKGTPDRKNLWAAQTPQVIKRELLSEAYTKLKDWQNITDDVQLVEKLGKKVKIVEGSYDNIKITTQEDLLIAEAMLKEQK
ncbi:2-C-methyl-D-erythritol 4-phosphate cytidylyltransferase [Candidatus Margulisiibacteriota bacterium]